MRHPAPTVEQAQALLKKLDDPATPRSHTLHLLRIGIVAYLTRKRYQASPKFKATNAAAVRRYREKHGESLSSMRSKLMKAEWRLTQMEQVGTDGRHQARYERALADVLSRRRAYAIRVGMNPDELNEAGELHTVSQDDEAFETAELVESVAGA